MADASSKFQGIKAGVLFIALLAVTACGGGGKNNNTVKLSVSVSGSGTVASQPAGITCTSTCSAQFATNSSVTLTATAAAGKVFSGWSGACSGSGACTVQMSAERSVGATFTTIPTSAWTPQQLVSGQDVYGLGYQQLAMTPDGSAMITWIQTTVDNNAIKSYVLWYSRYSPTTGWSKAAEAAKLGEDIDTQSAFALSADGSAVYAWRKSLPSNIAQYVYAVNYSPNSGWSTVRTLNTVTKNIFEVKAGLDEKGAGFVAWSQFQDAPKDTEVGIWTNRYNGSWGTAQMLNTDRHAANSAFNLAVMPNGNALAVWNDGSSKTDGDGYKAAFFSAAWGAPVRIFSNTSNDAISSYDSRPSLAVSNAGAVLTWAQTSLLAGPPITTQGDIMSLRFKDGAWETTPRGVMLVADSGTTLPRTQAAINPQGVAAVGWQDWKSDATMVSRGKADGSWNTPENINNGLSGATDALQLGVANNGDIMAAWYQSGVGASNLNTSRYTAAGWSKPQPMMDYDPTKGMYGGHSLATNASGNAILGYSLALEVVSKGTQVFARTFKAL